MRCAQGFINKVATEAAVNSVDSLKYLGPRTNISTLKHATIHGVGVSAGVSRFLPKLTHRRFLAARKVNVKWDLIGSRLSAPKLLVILIKVRPVFSKLESLPKIELIDIAALTQIPWIPSC